MTGNDEARNVVERYARRAGVPADRYSPLRPEVWQMLQERQRVMLRRAPYRESVNKESPVMPIPFRPVARSASGSTSGEKADMARRARRTRGPCAPRPPGRGIRRAG